MKLSEKIALFSFFILVSFFCHREYINDFPSYTHAWSQSDRFALANGFVDNDLNLFKPQTSVYNHPIPNEWTTADSTRITSVDFALHDFVPAVFMKLSGNRAPVYFRMYILLYGFLGLFFLYKLSRLFNNSEAVSLFVVIFAATTPVFVYYHSGFLPTIPSLSNAVIGIFFYFTYLRGKQVKFYYLAILFLCLAALCRTTFAIPLVAVFGYEFIQLFKNRVQVTQKLIASIISIVVLVAYFLYNAHLRETYGSLFLNRFLPARSWTEFKEILKEMYEKWLFHYFSVYHYLIFAVITLIAGFFFVVKKKRLSFELGALFLFTVILFLGNGLFFLLMSRQFVNHDYYFTDTFYLSVLLTLIVLSNYVSYTTRLLQMISFVLIAVLTSLFVFNAVQTQQEKRITGSWDVVSNSIHNFRNSEPYILKHGITANERILVLQGYTPNIPFLLMNRTGYCTMSATKKAYKHALKFPVKYIIFQNDNFFPEIYSVYPEIINHLEFVSTNGKITICKKRNPTTKQSLDKLLHLSKSQVKIERTLDFNEPVKGFNRVREANSKNYIGELSRQSEFGVLFESKNDRLFYQKATVLKIEGKVKRLSNEELNIVISFTDKDSLVYYKFYPLNKKPDNKNWVKFTNLFQFPGSSTQLNEVKVYLWNPKGGIFQCDDVHFEMY